jgi:creatinine amidohydrolase/Fe(II)-dependent formamide hydrolase-like protein
MSHGSLRESRIRSISAVLGHGGPFEDELQRVNDNAFKLVQMLTVPASAMLDYIKGYLSDCEGRE